MQSSLVLSAIEGVCAATQKLFAAPELDLCQSENDLRRLWTVFFLEWDQSNRFIPEYEQKNLFTKQYERDQYLNNKQLDVTIRPTRPRLGELVMVGEMKFLTNRANNCYVQLIGERLSDLHCLESIARDAKVSSFFLDVTLKPKVFGDRGYTALKQIRDKAIEYLYPHLAQQNSTGQSSVPDDKLKNQKFIQTYAKSARNYTARRQQRDFGFLFPPIDLGSKQGGLPVRGQAFVKKVERNNGLFRIGVRRAGREKITPYLKMREGKIAACFVLFDEQGEPIYKTDKVVPS